MIRAAERRIPPGTQADLVEEEVHPLVDIIAATRRWLGFAPARLTLAVPLWAVRLVGRGADLLGRLGWRSPLRSTAVEALGTELRGVDVPVATGRYAPCFWLLTSAIKVYTLPAASVVSKT